MPPAALMSFPSVALSNQLVSEIQLTFRLLISPKSSFPLCPVLHDVNPAAPDIATLAPVTATPFKNSFHLMRSIHFSLELIF